MAWTKENYIEALENPVPLTEQEHSDTADLYFTFLKSIIYCKASENLNQYPWIPGQLKELNMTILAILSSHRYSLSYSNHYALSFLIGH